MPQVVSASITCRQEALGHRIWCGAHAPFPSLPPPSLRLLSFLLSCPLSARDFLRFRCATTTGTRNSLLAQTKLPENQRRVVHFNKLGKACGSRLGTLMSCFDLAHQLRECQSGNPARQDNCQENTSLAHAARTSTCCLALGFHPLSPLYISPLRHCRSRESLRVFFLSELLNFGRVLFSNVREGTLKSSCSSL